MQKLKFALFIAILLICQIAFGQTTMVSAFDKVIISPHIQVTFVEGDKESVAIEKSTVSADKINIEVNDRTLRVYLNGAKDLEKNETTYENGYKEKRSLYQGTVIVATITYKTMNTLSVRGEETQVCKSVLKGEKFKLKIYGESEVILDGVSLGELQTTIYGESSLVIKSGSVKDQKYTAYGESKINSLAVSGNTGKITAYGEANFRMNVSDEIKITAFGEAKLEYKGNPEIIKGLNFGGVQIAKID